MSVRGKKIDIICPLYNAANYVVALNESLLKQKNIEIKQIHYLLTESSDESEEKLAEIGAVKDGKNEKVIYRIIKKSEFSHSLTREKEAKKCTGDIVVFVTQDVVIKKDDWLEKLVCDIAVPCKKGDIAADYSRQRCDNTTIERYTREKNYPAKSHVMSSDDVPVYGLKTFFSSDASSAINRKVFDELGYFDGKDMAASEDMYITRKVIEAGYKVKYAAESEVWHSHKMTIREIYKRYVNMGKFFKVNPDYKQFGKTESGSELAKYIWKRAWQERNFAVILRFPFDMAARLLGMRKGQK